MTSRFAATVIAGALGVIAGAAGAADVQGIGLPRQDRRIPIEINADDGIEWHQKTSRYIARGNARAAQGDVAVHADELIAYYRSGKGGKNEIWRIDADRNVRIVSPTQTAYGDKAVYMIDDAVLVLKGKVRLITPTDRITARDSLEYWEKRNMAVARGDAMVARQDKRLRADVLTAHFLKGEDGKTRIRQIDAFDNVMISSAKEIVRAKEGVYDVVTGIAKLSGSVKITRGANQLNGEYAEVNLNTGVSRLYSGGTGRVQGLIVPNTVDRKARKDKP